VLRLSDPNTVAKCGTTIFQFMHSVSWPAHALQQHSSQNLTGPYILFILCQAAARQPNSLLHGVLPLPTALSMMPYTSTALHPSDYSPQFIALFGILAACAATA
jgi:hypothetical protein